MPSLIMLIEIRHFLLLFLKKKNALFIDHRIDYFRIFSFMKYERKIMHIMLNNDLVLTTIYVTGDTFIPSRIFWSCLL